MHNISIWMTNSNVFFKYFKYSWAQNETPEGLLTEGGPLQMLLTPALNLLLACPKNVAAGTTFGPYRKIRKVNHLYMKFGTFKNFFVKKFRKNFTSGFLRQTLFTGTLELPSRKAARCSPI